jgi:hypothetical protein
MPSNDVLKEKLLKIRNKRGQIVPFKANRSQQEYRKKKTRRNLILKGRQQGISKEIDADQLIDCIKKSTNAVVISHEKEATKRLFSAVKFFVDNMEVKPELSIDSKSEMKFPKRGSSYFIGTAGQKAFGRGDTVDRAHLSEAAFYPNLKIILAGITEAAEYGQIDIETTPNGREEFYDMWQRAKAGFSPYTPIFIPWYLNEEYDSTQMTDEEKAGLSVATQELFNIPEEDFQYTDEEKDLINRVKQEYDMTLTVGQIKWRRYKIWDKGDLFFQEYPEDDVSCFLQSGRSVFKHIKTDITKRIPLDDISKMREVDRRRLLGDKNKGTKSKTLYAGLDPAEGILTGDAHCFSVIEPDAAAGKSVVIYEYTSNEPIDVFALKVAKICQVFDVYLGVEEQGVGVAMVQKLRDLQRDMYDNLWFKRWNTTGTTRTLLITDLEEAYRKEELIETYPEAEDEARNMVYNEKNRPEHPNGKHDDRVFSRGIALQMMKGGHGNYEEW